MSSTLNILRFIRSREEKSVGPDLKLMYLRILFLYSGKDICEKLRPVQLRTRPVLAGFCVNRRGGPCIAGLLTGLEKVLL